MELRIEVKEARRISMLHAPSKVMDMEHEIAGLREQLTEKALEVVLLRKEVMDYHTRTLSSFQIDHFLCTFSPDPSK